MSYSILTALDESSWSTSAADTSLWLNQHAEVRLTALNVVNVTQTRGGLIEDLAGLLGFEPVLVPQQVEAHFVGRGQNLLEDFEARCTREGVRCNTVLDQGGVVERICHHGRGHNLVIMGVRGETEQRFPGHGGGTMERVLRRTHSSTLVVPRGQSDIQGITLGFDGSPGARRALQSAADLASRFHVPLHLVQVLEARGDENALDGTRATLESLDVPTSTIVVKGEPQEALPAEAVRLGCNVLAMGYRGRSHLKNI
ncbi:MAG: universal stress protein, partial [Myxococcota bacterium]|nr:universal stress protein [Myxococcota bacterium]